MGDSIDNIKGVPGIGEKGARDLIATYGSLEELLAHAPEVTNKRYREGLLGHAEDARQSRELARIRTDVPVPFEPEALRYRGASRDRCFELFTRLGFRSLVLEYAPTAETVGKDYAVVRSLDELNTLVSELARVGRFGIHVLADDPAPMRAGIVGLSFSTGPHQARYVPLAATATVSEGLFGAAEDDRRRPRTRRSAGGAEAAARERGRAQDRARSEGRRDPAVAPRHRAARARDRRHDRELSARRDAIVAPARGSRDRAHRLQGADGRGRLRPRRQGGLVRVDPGGADARLRRRALGPGACSSPPRCWR